jgi:hypothetical protein
MADETESIERVTRRKSDGDDDAPKSESQRFQEFLFIRA